jgi:hypothetical protein
MGTGDAGCPPRRPDRLAGSRTRPPRRCRPAALTARTIFGPDSQHAAILPARCPLPPLTPSSATPELLARPASRTLYGTPQAGRDTHQRPRKTRPVIGGTARPSPPDRDHGASGRWLLQGGAASRTTAWPVRCGPGRGRVRRSARCSGRPDGGGRADLAGAGRQQLHGRERSSSRIARPGIGGPVPVDVHRRLQPGRVPASGSVRLA